jgi:hypothetical protein
MRLVDVTPVPGGYERLYVDEDGNVVDEFIADVEPVLDRNVRYQNGDKPPTGPGWEMIFSIPETLAWKWKREIGVDVWSNDPEQQERVKRLVNDLDWKKLKTVDERL